MKPLFTLAILLFILSSCKETKDDLIDRAIKLKEKGKCQEAIEIYSRLITNNYKLQIPYYNRGLCYMELEEYSKALVDFNMVMSLQRVGDFIITYNKDVPFSNDEAKYQVPYDDAVYGRAQALFELDSLRSSFRDFSALSDKGYEKANCLLWQGIIWIKSGDSTRACETFTLAKGVAQDDTDKTEADGMLDQYCRYIQN